ncbi:sensor histidine kinase [Salisediminibacterium selenitireducens]|uniref:histidine kinase n=1 Tax=Bacillus selenitireducens (strain ATCC 700615 / DSM 15326 / MLS10) TaxID=439292 RepID=D6XWJ2_BACIE|nr:sensor histidine kinase [Salisediminibacterium selenitireducens]ADH97834.1 integral membrane sensor signal transduction histidine kinase [[Bacillus] selenitireducens MLS10]
MTEKRRKWQIDGIVWDALRTQINAALAAFTVTLFLLLSLYQLGVNPPGANGAYTLRFTDVALLLFVFAVIFLSFTAVFNYRQAARVKRGLVGMIYQLKQYQRSGTYTPLSVTSKDELARLADELNGLTESVEERMVALRRMVNENSRLVKEAEQGASLEERRKLARDLHDAVSQELFSVSMSLSAIPKLMEKDPDKARQLFERIEKMVHHTQQELRALIMHLRPVTLEGKPLNLALSHLFDELTAKQPDMQFHCDLEDLPSLEKGVEEHVFRAIQEGISNALRHARASKLSLSVKRAKDLLLVTLSDDGDGFDLDSIDEERTGNVGLSAMKERMTEIGGNFTCISIPQKGTRLEFRVPIIHTKEDTEDGED